MPSELNQDKNIGVAAIGDVLDVNCWSNIPYYFFTTGQKSGLFQNPFSLNLARLSQSRKTWNLKQLILFRRPGGYQYSPSFLEKAESQIPENYYTGKVISFNQIFPRASTILKEGGSIYYYIDSTLYDLFKDPSYQFNLSRKVMDQALLLEKENYTQAKKIVTMGSWVRKSLVEHYGIPEYKIETVLPGSNLRLPQDYCPPVWKPGAGKERPFVFGFVGKDWKRKGLPLLINLKNGLKDLGYKVKILVIGNAPKEIESDKDIEFAGFINKASQMELFVSKLGQCDIGCLFSKGEALGISTLEFIKVGIPVTGFYHQGLLDTLFPEVSLRFSPEESLENMILRFSSYFENEEEQKQKFLATGPLRDQIGWENCVQNWSRILK
jgi:glycosyltransferase involved in cell wall biosynthesis